MVIVEGQSSDLTIVRVSVLFGDVLEGPVGDVGVAGHRFLTPLSLAKHLLGYLPQAHGAVPGTYTFGENILDYVLQSSTLHVQVSGIGPGSSVRFSQRQCY